MTWNCYGFKTSIYDIEKLCKSYDLIFIQEHWLRSDELDCFNSVHNDFTGQGLSGMATDKNILTGRPYGGVGVLWRKSLAKHVSIQYYEDDRIIGLHVEL